MISLSHAFDSLNLMRKGRRWERERETERTVIGVGNTSVNKNNHETVFCHLKDDEQIGYPPRDSPLWPDLHIQIARLRFRLFSSIVNRSIASCCSCCSDDFLFPVKDTCLCHRIRRLSLSLFGQKDDEGDEENVSYPMVPLINPQFQHCQSVYTRSKSLFLLVPSSSSSLYVPYRSLTCHNYERASEKRWRSWFVDERQARRQRREKKRFVRRRFFLFLSLSLSRQSFTGLDQWLIFFGSFSLSRFSLSNHSKLSWSMMMVGSALSFDLDASRLIYTSNTWHFFPSSPPKTVLQFASFSRQSWTSMKIPIRKPCQ